MDIKNSQVAGLKSKLHLYDNLEMVLPQTGYSKNVTGSKYL
jgi:hypothetical protein